MTTLGPKVTSHSYSWADLVHRAWGSEFNAPDHGAYQFTGRRFDSTDKGSTGIYNGGVTSTPNNPGPGNPA